MTDKSVDTKDLPLGTSISKSSDTNDIIDELNRSINVCNTIGDKFKCINKAKEAEN